MALRFNKETNQFEQVLEADEKMEKVTPEQRYAAKVEALNQIYKGPMQNIEQALQDPTITEEERDNLINRKRRFEKQFDQDLNTPEDN